MYSSDSERKHLPGMGESPNTSNYRKSTSRETEGVMFLMHSKLPLTHDKSLSYRNQPIDLQSKSMDWFLYDRTSVMKDLAMSMFDCRYH